MNDSHTKNFGRRFIAVVGSVVALVSLVSMAAPVAVSGVAAQKVVGQNPSAVIIPDIDPLAFAANEALEQLQIDLVRFDGGEETSVMYVRLRREAAQIAAKRLALDPAELEAAWADSDIQHQTALLAALTQVGVPYKRFARKPGIGFDCSGLTSFAWSQAGFNIPHNSTRQIRAADPRTKDTAQAGDLLRYPGHVMMWLGVGQAVIHSPQPRQFVEVKILNTRTMKRSTFGDPTE
jgi:cell wall-associated NlpC family hydrolase